MKYRVIILTLLLISFTLTVGLLLLPKAKATEKTVSASPKTIWVPDNYTKIQWAIDNASSGDTIRVRAGTYYENVTIKKDNLTLIGENRSNTIIDGGTVYIGYYYYDANRVSISEFTIQNSAYAGIQVRDSKETIINNTIISKNGLGISLITSSDIILRNNNMTENDYNFQVIGGETTHDIDNSNRVDGKPLYYWVNQHNKQIPSDAGYVAVINSTNIIVKDLNLTKNNQGVLFVYTNNSMIMNVNSSGNIDGIDLYWSFNNTLINNTASKNYLMGVNLWRSGANTLTDNNMTDNRWNFGVGGGAGGYVEGEYINNIDTSNKVNGKKVYYLVNQSNLIVDPSTCPNLGYIGVINSTNVTVRNLNVTNNRQGVLFAYTTNSIITNVSTSNNEIGISLYYCTNNNITGNTTPDGVGLEHCHDNVIIENTMTLGLLECNNNVVVRNTITGSGRGISLSESSVNYIIGNTFLHTTIGLYYSSDNVIYHNNFISDGKIVRIWWSGKNTWDNGAEGNYWSDYNDIDANQDGIGDSPFTYFYFIDSDENNTDNYPLMGMFTSFNTSLGYQVNVISNSTIEDFQYFESNSTIKIHVSNTTATQTYGFCRIRIPHALMNETYNVTIDGAEPYYVNYTLYDDRENRWIYFSYQHSTLEIVIVPEFQSALILPLYLIITLIAVVLRKTIWTQE